MTIRTFTGLANTRRGQTQQLNHAFHGMAEDMKRRAVAAADCDQPTTLPAALRVIESLQQQLADAQALIDDMRAQANSDVPAESAPERRLSGYWDSKMVAEMSGVAVCTICRNAKSLGGIKLGGDWVFPKNTTYGIKRQQK